MYFGKEPACNAGDPGSILGLVRSPGGGYGNPLQYSCLENPMDRGAWQATVREVASVRHALASKPPPPPRVLGEFGGEWIHVYGWLSHSAVHLKPPQHCQLATFQYKIKR